MRRPDQLAGLGGLVVPGREHGPASAARPRNMDEAIVAFHRAGGVLLGTCAGLILFAKEVASPGQPSLGLLDVTVDRNAFGRQVDSFVDQGRLRLNGTEVETEMVFIRAPRIRRVGPAVEVLGTWNGEPVLVRQGRIFGATFHPEMSPQSPFPQWFVQQVASSQAIAPLGQQAGSREDITP
ncbi:MAG: pyridoxal 5'-phosphate synthase glutaminase subunit PdxT [Candidatus Eisenbacteria bacterium]